jgi:malic enzyme
MLLNKYKAEFAVDSEGSLADAVRGSDVFVGVSKAKLLTEEMLKSMNENPIVFALANPEPEILWDVAHEWREDVIMATGRSDLPNQVNNVLAFPGIFRGALDSRASCINEEMKKAAVFALAGMVEIPTRERFVPEIFEKGVVEKVAGAVADVARKS